MPAIEPRANALPPAPWLGPDTPFSRSCASHDAEKAQKPAAERVYSDDTMAGRRPPGQTCLTGQEPSTGRETR